MRTPLVVLVLACVATLPATAAPPETPAAAPASAAGAPPPEAAEAYRAGVEHFKAKRYADAIAEFNKAYRIAPNSVLVFNMARAFEELKEFDSAVEFYRRYLEMEPQAADRAAVQDAIRTLELLSKRQKEPETGTLTVQSTPDGAAVFIDGRPVGRTPLKTEVSVGAHFVSVEKDGFSRATKELTITGEPMKHSATLVPMAVSTPDAGEPSDVAAWLLMGVGGSMLVGGGIIGVLALDQNDRLDKIEAGERSATRSEFNDIQDTGRLYAYLADGLLVGGLAAALTGGILLFTGDDDAPKTARGNSLLEWTF